MAALELDEAKKEIDRLQRKVIARDQSIHCHIKENTDLQSTPRVMVGNYHTLATIVAQRG